MHADLAYLDCSTAGFAGAEKIKSTGQIPADRRALVLFRQTASNGWKVKPESPRPIATRTWRSGSASSSKLEDSRHPSSGDTPGDRELALLDSLVGSCVGPVLELYFPNQAGPAYVHSVGEGLSGTPLVRIEFAGNSAQYM